MKLWEALKLLDEGKKVRRTNWYDGFYIYKNSRKYISHSKNDEVSIDVTSYNLDADEWEVYDDRSKIHKELSWLKEGHVFFSNGQYCNLKGCDNCPLRSFVVNGVELSCDSLSDIFYHLNNKYRLDK